MALLGGRRFLDERGVGARDRPEGVEGVGLADVDEEELDLPAVGLEDLLQPTG